MFTVICDNCGKDSNDGAEYSCFGDKQTAEYSAEDSNWLNDNGKHYCPDCYSYDDEDKLVLKSIIHKP